jgi:hypothetical protein
MNFSVYGLASLASLWLTMALRSSDSGSSSSEYVDVAMAGPNLFANCTRPAQNALVTSGRYLIFGITVKE